MKFTIIDFKNKEGNSYGDNPAQNLATDMGRYRRSFWRMWRRRFEEGYLLKYEGWSGVCVGKVWLEVETEQLKRCVDIESEEAEEERENACYEYAEEQSYKIIDDEWKPELKERGYRFIDGGYDIGGLYGRTWALFKKHISYASEIRIPKAK